MNYKYEEITQLEKKYPCRSSFIKNLYDLLSRQEECFPPSIYVYGHAGSGKTSIFKDFLQQRKNKKEIRGAYVNCIECYTLKILFENCLELINDGSQIKDLRCDSLKQFVEFLKNENMRKSYVLALDNAERLRDMEANILPSFLRLQELTGLNICVVLISQIPFEKFHNKTGLTEVIILRCLQYSKVETLKILSSQFEMAKQMLKTHVKEKLMVEENSKYDMALKRQTDIINTLTSDFFDNYLNVFLSVFYKACRDVPELKITACKCFITYMEPVFNESIDISDVSRLWRNIATPLRIALSRVYMRYGRTQNNNILVHDDNYSDQSVKKMAQSLELPFYGKYLLIAAFLASHNSAKEDKRLFMKHHGKQRKRVQTVHTKSKLTEKMSISLGPKSFSIDRLLAIFYAIIDEKVGLTCNLLSQISTLVHLKLLGFASAENNVMDGSARLQCNVGLEFIIHIGKVVGFNVYQYLCDFM